MQSERITTSDPRQVPNEVASGEPDAPHGARRSQRQQILKLLLDARGQWVPAPALAAISLQYSARVRELRLDGWRVDNRCPVVRGVKRGEFRLQQYMTVEHGGLVSTPAQTQAQPERERGDRKVASSLDMPSLFPDLVQAHRDDG